jgi:hypothetical protein
MATLKFTNLLFLLRDVPTGVRFYGPDGLGMKVIGAATSWAVLEADGLRISLQQAEGFFFLSSFFFFHSREVPKWLK